MKEKKKTNKLKLIFKLIPLVTISVFLIIGYTKVGFSSNNLNIGYIAGFISLVCFLFVQKVYSLVILSSLILGTFNLIHFSNHIKFVYAQFGEAKIGIQLESFSILILFLILNWKSLGKDYRHFVNWINKP